MSSKNFQLYSSVHPCMAHSNFSRADVKQYIGLPTPAAVFKIFHSCLSELMRVGIITPNRQILDLRALEIMRFTENEATRLSLRLRDIARYYYIMFCELNIYQFASSNICIHNATIVRKIAILCRYRFY